ncbi:MAG: EAL domain-containing protein [Pseudomonadota bacterium]
MQLYPRRTSLLLSLPVRQADRFTVEVTENRLVQHEANVLEVLSRFRLLGFKLSMDDFGTGATSFEQLRLYPFSELKIDRSFIQNAREDDFSKTTVETSARLAAMLGISVVAEGIETDDQLKLATDVGAESIQGFLISRPLSASQLTEWVKRFNTASADAA